MKEADKVYYDELLNSFDVYIQHQDGDGTLDIDEFVSVLLQYG